MRENTEVIVIGVTIRLWKTADLLVDHRRDAATRCVEGWRRAEDDGRPTFEDL